MGKVIALFVCIGVGLLLRALMYSNTGMGLMGGAVLAVAIILLVAEMRKI